MSNRAIVVDANILIRAVLGKRVREIIWNNVAATDFFVPDVALADARTYLPFLLKKRGLNSEAGMKGLNSLESFVRVLSSDVYAGFQKQAMLRIGARDPDDWPELASAMAIDCPVWTEDADFFGTGVPVWTTDRVELYLSA
jgi:predicted nucleic acid-binding protein